MSLAEHLFKRITTDPAFTALCGDRLFRLRGAMDATPPRVLYEIDTNDFERDSDGTTGERSADLTYHCFGVDDEQADKISEVLLNRLANYSGTVANVEITEIAPSTDLDDSWSEDLEETHKILEMRVSYRRANSNI